MANSAISSRQGGRLKQDKKRGPGIGSTLIPETIGCAGRLSLDREKLALRSHADGVDHEVVLCFKGVQLVPYQASDAG